MGFAAFTQVPIPVALATVLKAKMEKVGPYQVRVQNLDVNDIVVSLGESDDDVTYAALGSSVTVKAGGVDLIDVVQHKQYMRVRGSGGGQARLTFNYEGQFLLGNIDVLVYPGKLGFGSDV